MYPEQPKMVITQVINIPKGTRGRLHRALDEHRIHKWSRRKLQGEHDASITWIFHTPQTLITLTSANAHQSHLKRTSNAPQTHFKRISKTLRLLGFCNFMTPQKPFKGQVPCTPISEENLFISHYTLNKATQNGHNSDYKCTQSSPKWS